MVMADVKHHRHHQDHQEFSYSHLMSITHFSNYQEARDGDGDDVYGDGDGDGDGAMERD